LKDFNKAIELNPNDVDYYYNRGILYCRLEEYQEALSDFNKVLE
jgi:tetratricopeptide (TPR) repeat protein